MIIVDIIMVSFDLEELVNFKIMIGLSPTLMGRPWVRVGYGLSSYGYGPGMGRDSTGTGRVRVEICLSHTGTGRVRVDSLRVGYGPGCHFHTRADL